jgi:hypothetical protein
MKTLVAILAAVTVLAVVAPAGAMPIDAVGPIPSDPPAAAPTPAPAPAPSSGTETWIVFAASALAFAAGASATRLVPVLRLRTRAS